MKISKTATFEGLPYTIQFESREELCQHFDHLEPTTLEALGVDFRPFAWLSIRYMTVADDEGETEDACRAAYYVHCFGNPFSIAECRRKTDIEAKTRLYEALNTHKCV